MKEILNIRCKNNDKTLEMPAGSSLMDIYKQSGLDMEFGPISAKVNNKWNI